MTARDTMAEFEFRATCFETSAADVSTLERIAKGLRSLGTDHARRSRCSQD